MACGSWSCSCCTRYASTLLASSADIQTRGYCASYDKFSIKGMVMPSGSVDTAVATHRATSEYLHPAFVNHLSFLACHRGTIDIGPDGVHVRSDIEGFSCWAPAHPNAVLPADAAAVRINS